MGKPTICIGENKDADQLRGNREADQRLCFRYSDSTIPLLLKSEISSFWLFSMLVQASLCRTCSETTLLVFSRGGSNLMTETTEITNLNNNSDRMDSSFQKATVHHYTFVTVILLPTYSRTTIEYCD